jgi:hypothetical protein
MSLGLTTWSRMATQRADNESPARRSRNVFLANRTSSCQVATSSACGKLMMHRVITRAAWKRKYLSAWLADVLMIAATCCTYVAYHPSSLLKSCVAY